ncbi:uncharacterized protein MONOS_13746 [Monocercomonoides exilis]|uniref:uncharacterized protein n=1 Tax=Monocercomonoides exilis TaxID=2049356 RepID=UPI003559C042|nr:hypothetical protein MONOS_13746 [Monocercomonoides exilis]|eukprot:MONOS_13746.1-p1 / transcript=MONOS_13746.1 / gene=MONOS_13746 / organism=Monocercomonoides_exilis_PA203 / gene_product=unspecified product / transcript_product=unspecified product / location=Mono_scaffold00876:5820-6117(-) / protein_length=74 / sequence_SO=supercontig / SO=protein_coding / is_pseudo=false
MSKKVSAILGFVLIVVGLIPLASDLYKTIHCNIETEPICSDKFRYFLQDTGFFSLVVLMCGGVTIFAVIGALP